MTTRTLLAYALSEISGWNVVIAIYQNGGFTYQQFRATLPSVFVFAVMCEYMLCSFPARHHDLLKLVYRYYRKHAGTTNRTQVWCCFTCIFSRLELRGFEAYGKFRITSYYIPLDHCLFVYIYWEVILNLFSSQFADLPQP